MKSTPSIPAEIMCATRCRRRHRPDHLDHGPWFLYQRVRTSLVPRCLRDISSVTSTRCTIGCAQGRNRCRSPKISLKPRSHSIPRLSPGRAARRGGRAGSSRAVQSSRAGRMNRIAHHVDEPGDVLRNAQSHRHVELLRRAPPRLPSSSCRPSAPRRGDDFFEARARSSSRITRTIPRSAARPLRRASAARAVAAGDRRRWALRSFSEFASCDSAHANLSLISSA